LHRHDHVGVGHPSGPSPAVERGPGSRREIVKRFEAGTQSARSASLPKLAQANEQFAVAVKDFVGAIEDDIGNGCEARNRVARGPPGGMRWLMARICSSAVPTHNGCAAVGRFNAGAPGVYVACSEASEDENTSTRFIARIGDKEAFATRVINDHAALRLACGAMKQKHGIMRT